MAVFIFLAFGFAPYPCNRSRGLSGRAVQDADIDEMRARHCDLTHFDSLLQLTPSLISGQLSPRCLNKDTATLHRLLPHCLSQSLSPKAM